MSAGSFKALWAARNIFFSGRLKDRLPPSERRIWMHPTIRLLFCKYYPCISIILVAPASRSFWKSILAVTLYSRWRQAQQSLYWSKRRHIYETLQTQASHPCRLAVRARPRDAIERSKHGVHLSRPAGGARLALQRTG